MHDPARLLRRCLLPLLLWACVPLPAPVAETREEPQLVRLETNPTVVRVSTRVARGVYRISDGDGGGVIRITADGVTLDLAGATLIGAPDGTEPDQYTGTAIAVVGARDVTIRGGRIRGYKIAVRARDAPGLVLEGIDASGGYRQRLKSTPARADPSDWLWPHENDEDEWEQRYGAGFSLTGCIRARVRGCRVRNGQNGLLLTRCARVAAFDNDFSFNSGWGIALYRSTRCVISHNRCDWCVRGYSHGRYHRGQDSAGILVFEQSSGNTIAHNSATHGGDGLFLYGGHETTKRTGKGGCNDNLVFENDFSHAVANAIEATFSTGNVFVRNDCSDADHGIWAGYSSSSLFSSNKIHGCSSAGISIEHGQENRIQFNEITGGQDGIHLWWDPDEVFVNGVFGAQRSTKSARNVIHGNDVLGARTALRLEDDQGSAVRWNVLSAKEALLFLGPRTRLGKVLHNHLRGPRVPGRLGPLAVVNRSGAAWTLPSENSRRGPLRGAGALDPRGLPEEAVFLRPRARGPATPTVLGSKSVKLPRGMPRGRAEIRIGPWGPLDPRLPHVYPTTLRSSARTVQVQLSGRGRFAVTKTEGRIVARPTEGRLPALLTIETKPGADGGPTPALVPFTVDLLLGAVRETVRGTLLEARWTVRFFEWTIDPRESEAAFQRLLSGKPVVESERPALDFAWRGAGPQGVRRDRFATLATTKLWLPAGRYRLRTVSDDGIRVYVDGKRVTDNWTHHAPTEDVAVLRLEAGEHTLRIEHFEIDGHAHLTFDLERLP